MFQPAALQTAVSLVTVAILWLAALGRKGFLCHIVEGASEAILLRVFAPVPLATLLLRAGFRLELSTYMLLGAPLG